MNAWADAAGTSVKLFVGLFGNHVLAGARRYYEPIIDEKDAMLESYRMSNDAIIGELGKVRRESIIEKIAIGAVSAVAGWTFASIHNLLSD